MKNAEELVYGSIADMARVPKEKISRDSLLEEFGLDMDELEFIIECHTGRNISKEVSFRTVGDIIDYCQNF